MLTWTPRVYRTMAHDSRPLYTAPKAVVLRTLWFRYCLRVAVFTAVPFSGAPTCHLWAVVNIDKTRPISRADTGVHNFWNHAMVVLWRKLQSQVQDGHGSLNLCIVML